MPLNHTLMEHPDRPEEGVIRVPLNEWARYRKSGYEFCNHKEQTIANAEAAEQADEEAGVVEADADAAPTKRRTKPKED